MIKKLKEFIKFFVNVTVHIFLFILFDYIFVSVGYCFCILFCFVFLVGLVRAVYLNKLPIYIRKLYME